MLARNWAQERLDQGARWFRRVRHPVPTVADHGGVSDSMSTRFQVADGEGIIVMLAEQIG